MNLYEAETNDKLRDLTQAEIDLYFRSLDALPLNQQHTGIVSGEVFGHSMPVYAY